MVNLTNPDEQFCNGQSLLNIFFIFKSIYTVFFRNGNRLSVQLIYRQWLHLKEPLLDLLHIKSTSTKSKETANHSVMLHQL